MGGAGRDLVGVGMKRVESKSRLVLVPSSTRQEFQVHATPSGCRLMRKSWQGILGHALAAMVLSVCRVRWLVSTMLWFWFSCHALPDKLHERVVIDYNSREHCPGALRGHMWFSKCLPLLSPHPCTGDKVLAPDRLLSFGGSRVLYRIASRDAPGKGIVLVVNSGLAKWLGGDWPVE